MSRFFYNKNLMKQRFKKKKKKKKSSTQGKLFYILLYIVGKNQQIWFKNQNVLKLVQRLKIQCHKQVQCTTICVFFINI